MLTKRPTPPQLPALEPLMTSRQVAAYAGVSTRMVRRLVKDEVLPVVKIGRCPRFRPADVRAVFRPD